jgi:hypothetical protein
MRWRRAAVLSGCGGEERQRSVVVVESRTASGARVRAKEEERRWAMRRKEKGNR